MSPESDNQLSPRQQIVIPFDPGIRAICVLLVLAAAGFASLYLGWHHTARTLYVDLQVPWIASCGLGGLGVVGVALAAWHVHIGRRDDAREDHAWARLITASDRYVTRQEHEARTKAKPRARNKKAAR